MTLDSSNEVVAILYDIENAPFEMLNYTLGKARRYQPCRTIVVSDWEARPEQKRWEKLMRRPGFTFRQISRTYHGKNSLDSAIYDSAKLLYDEGVRRFFIITTDSDFVRIAEYLNSDTPSYIIGVGTKQASETLRNAYDEFMVYPPEEKEKKPARKQKAVKDEVKQEKKTAKAAKETTATKTAKTVKETKAAKTAKMEKAVKTAKNAKVTKAEDNAALSEGNLTVKLPRTLRESLQERQAAEGVSMDELVTYLLMRGMARWVED
ncbi:NYN domain-containing protein [Selenomonas ruminantium]|uniref:NYN domain-containing protein n=1 Tax=Selenomonas ruminantium TaxID=971 RepID=UPI0026F28BA8|nr:NYN domain-containing protein [Selenomonas ruminantium]